MRHFGDIAALSLVLALRPTTVADEKDGRFFMFFDDFGRFGQS